ncbi:hypothetical protein B0T17DRAFT_378932 [Bombardia bombarda]|uniref:Uncharacterized protein n=1 Tax=Bombardia bombarda TaxID=252184 RepID=A0AA40BVH1_9PEZI|nr:hypothetical protein B0T17DRAFT_378932 [Bombardia bombarda]
MLQLIQHPKIVTVHEIYGDKANHHIVYEHMPRSLQEAIGNPYLSRQRLAAIVGQVGLVPTLLMNFVLMGW